MPWNREPDPLEARRRQLAEQQRLIDEQMVRLTQELHGPGAAQKIPAQPLVWRSEDEHVPRKLSEPGLARRRHLARQRRRDMILFFILGMCFVLLAIVVWIVYSHNHAPVTGA